MKGRSALLGFTIHIHARLLHRLLQGLVDRAYQLGHSDAAQGRTLDTTRVHIDPSQIRKLQT